MRMIASAVCIVILLSCYALIYDNYISKSFESITSALSDCTEYVKSDNYTLAQRSAAEIETVLANKNKQLSIILDNNELKEILLSARKLVSSVNMSDKSSFLSESVVLETLVDDVLDKNKNSIKNLF